MLTITFARHGKYDGTRSILNAQGIEQANQLATALVSAGFHGNDTAILSSTSLRTLQTASPIRKALRGAGYQNVSIDEDVFLILMNGVSLLSPIAKSDDNVSRSVRWLSRLKSSSIIAVSHAENLLCLTAAFANAGGTYFYFGEAEAVTYQIDADSWAEATQKGLENCSQIVWKHGELLERDLG